MKKVSEPSIASGRDPVLNRMVYGVGKLGAVLRNGAWSAARAEGLTPTQGQILVLLRGRGRSGLRLAEVAGELGITSATASEAVATLEGKELVERRPAADDRRAISIRLTERGRRLAYRAMHWSDFMAEAFTSLSREERGVFLRALSKVMSGLHDADRIPAVRSCVSCIYFEADVRPDRADRHRCAYGDFLFDDTGLRLDCAAHACREQQQSGAAPATATAGNGP
jgi:DNA-binding MarR family transcriptional regulator